MAGLEKFNNFNRKTSMGIEWVGLVAFIFMMLVTVVDVISSKIFLKPVFGAIDAMMIAQLVSMSFAMSITLILGRHVQVEFFVRALPMRARTIVDCIVYLLGLVLFVVIVWRLFVYGYGIQIDGEVSLTARIPLHPFIYGAAVAFIPVCLVYLSLFIESVLKLIKK